MKAQKILHFVWGMVRAGLITAKQAVALLLALLIIGLSNASAAIPTEVVDMFGDIQTDAGAVITTYVVPAVALITGLWVLIKMAKKGASKIG